MLLEVVLTFLALYMILSLVLLRSPQLLHKRRTPAFEAAMICHRGGSGEFLENTMDAFSGCVELGCDLIELDCQLTKDEQVVVSHDNDLSRGTGKKVCVSDLNFDELPEYSTSVQVQFGFGEEHHVKPGASRRIPLLKSVFEAFPTVPINIDVKVDNDVMIHKVAHYRIPRRSRSLLPEVAGVLPHGHSVAFQATPSGQQGRFSVIGMRIMYRTISEMVKEFKREDITVWGSFSDLVNKKCHSENPRIPTFFPIKEVLWIVFTYYLGLLPFLPIKDDFFEIPLIRNFFRMPNVVEYLTSWISKIPRLLRLGVSDDVILQRVVWLADWFLMSPKLFAHLKARGIPVFIWVCNTAEDFDRAFAAGGQGVVTDYPSRLVTYLDQHPEIDRGLFTRLKNDGVARRLANRD